MCYSKIRRLNSSIDTLNTNLEEFRYVSKEANHLKGDELQEIKSLSYYVFLSIILMLYNVIYVTYAIRFISFRPVIAKCIAVNLKVETPHVILPWKRSEKINFNYTPKNYINAVIMFYLHQFHCAHELRKFDISLREYFYLLTEQLKRSHLIYWCALAQQVRRKTICLSYEGFYFENWIISAAEKAIIYPRAATNIFNLKAGVMSLKKQIDSNQLEDVIVKLNNQTFNLKKTNFDILCEKLYGQRFRTTDVYLPNSRIVLSSSLAEISAVTSILGLRSDVVLCVHPDTNAKVVSLLTHRGYKLSDLSSEIGNGETFIGWSSTALIELANSGEIVYVLKTAGWESVFQNSYWSGANDKHYS